MPDRYALSATRRRFLAAAAAVPTAWPAAGGWPMRLSASTVAFSKLPVEDACARIAALGFEAVDFWAPNWCDHLEVIRTRLGAAGLRELLARHKLKLYAFSVYGPGYEKYAKLLGDAGGGVAVRGSRRGSPADVTREMRAFLEELQPLGDLAGENNSFLAIENHGDALLHTLDSFKAFVDLNRHPRVGIAMAPYHLQRAGVRVEEAIQVTGSQLLFFYAWQNAEDEGQLPGVGPADFTPWLEALAQARYAWYVNPFMHHEPPPDEMSRLFVKSIDYLKGCHRRMG